MDMIQEPFKAGVIRSVFLLLSDPPTQTYSSDSKGRQQRPPYD